jgi:hypothetical protein
MQSIITQCVPPTGDKPARVKAYTATATVFVPYLKDVWGGEETAHFKAVVELCKKKGWVGKVVAGWQPKTDTDNVYKWASGLECYWTFFDSSNTYEITGEK